MQQLQLVAALLYGSRWFAIGDGFEVCSSLAARLSPWGRRDDRVLVVRNPLDGVATLHAAPGVAALFQGQQALILASDPLGIGVNWLGTATRAVDYTLLEPGALALIQAAALVGGHVLGGISAHDRTVALLPERHSVAGQVPLLVLMIGYTLGGLYLLFAT